MRRSGSALNPHLGRQCSNENVGEGIRKIAEQYKNSCSSSQPRDIKLQPDAQRSCRCSTARTAHQIPRGQEDVDTPPLHNSRSWIELCLMDSVPHCERQRQVRKLQVSGFAQQWEQARLGATLFEHHAKLNQEHRTRKKAPQEPSAISTCA